MSRRFQFSLRWLMVAASAVGPALIVGRGLLNLSWAGAAFLVFVCCVVAAILASQAALLKMVARSRKE